jgi:alanine racemase
MSTTPEPVEHAAEAGGILTIDLGALAANYRDLAGRAAPARCAAVVKADAYGIGIGPAVRALAGAGCDTFFVALLGEAREVREALPDATIYVLNGLHPHTAAAFREIRAQPVLGSFAEIEEWDVFARLSGATLPAAIHIDTGMRRHGLLPADATALAGGLKRLHFAPSLVMSHMACADEPEHPLNAQQIAEFRALAARFSGIPASLANSPALLALPDSRFDLVRPGVALYGGRAVLRGTNPMRPVVRLDLRIIQVRDARAGETVGYSATQTLTRNTRIAVVSAGYADGIPRSAGSSDRARGAAAVVHGRRCPILGRISMDLISIDVTDLARREVKRGDVATLLGEGITVDDLAEPAGTVGYEILTRLGRRYHRVYVNG